MTIRFHAREFETARDAMQYADVAGGVAILLGAAGCIRQLVVVQLWSLWPPPGSSRWGRDCALLQSLLRRGLPTAGFIPVEA